MNRILRIISERERLSPREVVSLLLDCTRKVNLGSFAAAPMTPGWFLLVDARSKEKEESILAEMCCVSPEYLASGRSDVQSDVFGIGALGYALLTGCHPHASTSLMSRLKLQLGDAPIDFAKLTSVAGADLTALIKRCLATSPEARPSPEALIVALDAWPTDESEK